MKTILFLLLLYSNCIETTPSIVGNWATVLNDHQYYEIYIDKEYIQFIDQSGVPSNKYKYILKKNKIEYPSKMFYIKYVDKDNIIFYNKTDTLFLNRIEVNKKDLNNFLLRKYKYLTFNNYISIDSARNEISKIKKYNVQEKRQIKEEQLNNLFNKKDTLKNK